MVTKNVSISSAAKVVVRSKAAKAKNLQREQLKAAEIEKQQREARNARWEEQCRSSPSHSWSDDPRD